MKKFVFLLLVFFTKSLFSFSLLLINDSPFELTATIHAADGTVLGQMVIKSGEQKRWSTSMSGVDSRIIYNNSVSLSPLSVVWKCGFQGYYSVNSNVSPEATVTANTGDGSKACTKKPTDKEKEEMYCPTCPTCPTIEPPKKETQVKKKES
jgi:hypothetical protein